MILHSGSSWVLLSPTEEVLRGRGVGGGYGLKGLTQVE